MNRNLINGEKPEFGNPEHIAALKKQVKKNQKQEKINRIKDESDEVYNWDDGDYDDDDSEDEVAYYYCIGCGNKQNTDGECNRCTGYSLDPVYF